MAKKIKKAKREKKNAKEEPGERTLISLSHPKIKKINIRFIGIGGGGGSIVSEMSRRIDKVSFVAANTDIEALKHLPKNVKKFSFGEEVTGGLGTGMNIELSEELAEKEKEKIKKLFKGQDVVIFISTLGGGTGSGASPVFVKIAQEFPLISLGIFTLPFHFEGKKKMQIAKESLEKMKPFLNAYFVIPNDRIFQMVEKKSSLRKGLFLLNKLLSDNLKEIIDLIFTPGIINIDFADFKTILNGKGKVFFMNTVEGSGKERVDKIVDSIFVSPLCDYKIEKSDSILFNIAGTGDLKMDEVKEISRTISHLNKSAKIIFGISKDKNPRSRKNREGTGRIKLTLLVVGSEKEVKKISSKKKERKEKARAKKPVKKEGVSKLKEKKKKAKKEKKKKKEKTILMGGIAKEDKKESLKRRTALEAKEDLLSAEKEILEKERELETPAFLRKGAKKIKISYKK